MGVPAETVRLVAASYARARGTGFATRFYEHFLRADADVRRRFAQTDFARQRELFLHGVFAMIDYAGSSATGELALRRLAQLHGSRGLAIPPRLYDLWADALLETLSEHDPEWTPTLASAWRTVLRPGLDVLLAG